jgi:hypothetical protein
MRRVARFIIFDSRGLIEPTDAESLTAGRCLPMKEVVTVLRVVKIGHGWDARPHLPTHRLVGLHSRWGFSLQYFEQFELD